MSGSENAFDYESAEYHQQRHAELLKDRDLRLAWSYFADLAYFSKVQAGQRVLEFGGGLGNNLMAVSKRATVEMVEPSDVGRSVAEQEGIKCYPSLEEMPAGKFDCILCRHVLEHVENPKAVLESLRDRLASTGELVVVLPVEKWNEMPDPQDLNHHLFCWNPQTISNLMQVAGLKATAIRWEYYGAKRKLMPVFRTRGGKAYARMVRLVGKVFRFRELLVEARSRV
jgi:SAM-dependent methyltransferase